MSGVVDDRLQRDRRGGARGERGRARARERQLALHRGAEARVGRSSCSSGDSNLLIDNPDQYTPYDNDVWVRNMCGDLSPPDITIRTPANGARYKLDQQTAIADYECTDEDDVEYPPFSDILYCDRPGGRRLPRRYVDRGRRVRSRSTPATSAETSPPRRTTTSSTTRHPTSRSQSQGTGPTCRAGA